tara:strand:- start:592 stop:705 length:114 start_codon:yes stop_codon:yes gene_type:complete
MDDYYKLDLKAVALHKKNKSNEAKKISQILISLYFVF